MADDRPVSCESTRARLLEVDLDRFPGPDDALAAHFAECPSCRRAARELRAEAAALGTALTGLTETRGLGDARAIALAESGIGGADGGRRVPSRPLETAARWAVAAAVLGLATAAGWRLAPRGEPTTRTASTAEGSLESTGSRAPMTGIPAAEPREAVFSVDVPSTGGVAVFATRNPKIRVVWFYDTDGTSGGGQ
jgi:hypothetical protein